MDLSILSKKDSLWRKIAYNICKCHVLADDIVNEMYLKAYEIDKEINDGYIYRIMKSIFIDIKRKEVFSIEIQNTNLSYEIEELDNFDDIKLKAVKTSYESLKTYEKIIFKHSFEDGLRKFARESGIGKNTVQKVRNKVKHNSWQKLKELEMQSKQSQNPLELNLVMDAKNDWIF